MDGGDDEMVAAAAAVAPPPAGAGDDDALTETTRRVLKRAVNTNVAGPQWLRRFVFNAIRWLRRPSAHKDGTVKNTSMVGNHWYRGQSFSFAFVPSWPGTGAPMLSVTRFTNTTFTGPAAETHHDQGWRITDFFKAAEELFPGKLWSTPRGIRGRAKLNQHGRWMYSIIELSDAGGEDPADDDFNALLLRPLALRAFVDI